MTWWQALLWALLGGGLTEVYDFYKSITRRKAWPWHKPKSKRRDPNQASPAIYATGTVLRLTMAAGVGAAFGASGQVSTPAVAVGLGLGAMAIVERAARHGGLPLPEGDTGSKQLDEKAAVQVERAQLADEAKGAER